jgi:hypothetical protein
MHALTPGGRFLCGKHCGSVTGGCHPTEALKEWMKLPESERRPGAVRVPELGDRDPQTPLPPPGGLVLKVCQSSLHRDAQGELHRQKHLFPDAYGEALRYEPGRDYIWLTRAQCASVVPEAPRKGLRFPVPAEVADEILYMLRDTSQGLTFPSARWSPRHIRSREMLLTVEDVSAERLRICLEGSVNLSGFVPEGGKGGEASLDARLLGYLSFDLKKQNFTRFDVVSLGEHVGWTGDLNHPRLNKPYVLGVTIEIATGGALAPPSTQFG